MYRKLDYGYGMSSAYGNRMHELARRAVERKKEKDAAAFMMDHEATKEDLDKSKDLIMEAAKKGEGHR